MGGEGGGSLPFAGVTSQELNSGLETGAGSHVSRKLLPGLRWGSESRCLCERNKALCSPLLPDTANLLQKVLREHTDPGMGFKIISKGQEKKSAGQPEKGVFRIF